MRRLIGLAGVVCVTAAVAVTAAAAASVPRVLSCAGKPLLRPAGLVVLSCADANSELRSTHWLSWGRQAAVGTTTLGLNPCKPYCAASRMKYFPNSRVRLSDPKQTSHGLVFGRATITYVSHHKRKTLVAYLPTRPL